VASPQEATWVWARGIHGARIAVGGMPQQYPLYGLDLSNHVDYIGHHGPHGSFSEVQSCREWRQQLNSGRYRFAVTAPVGPGSPAPPQREWTAKDPSARQVLQYESATIFELHGRLEPQAC
jgi:hypothetical protein